MTPACVDTRFFEISLVLNLHNETRYLRRTMLSLEEAVRFTRHNELTVEIVVVLDRPAASTRDWIAAYDFSAFDASQVIEVDNGSLGLSRNSGIDVARGEYIGTVDADDLVSYNMFSELHLKASTSPRETIVIQQYVYAFGEEFFLVKYFGTDKVSKLGFFSYHPGVSRIFAHRSLFEKLRYRDARLSEGYAYEDWHFNCEAIAMGYELAVAPDTVMYYRQRANSLLRSADQISVRQIPPSNYFRPRTYVTLCAADYDRYLRGDISSASPQDSKRDFEENSICFELTRAASRIDPAITIRTVCDMPAFSNLSPSLQSGAAYYRLSKLLAGSSFTDVVLVPFLSRGGGDKYILDIIDGLSRLDPNRRFLVLAGQPFGNHAWLDRLPKSSLFIDLHFACDACSELDIRLVTLRIIQSVASQATIHLKSSEYAVHFFKCFGRVLPDNDFVFYRFADPIYPYRGSHLCAGFIFNFFSEFGERLSTVITDNHTIAAFDQERLDSLAERWRVLPARCSVTGRKRSDDANAPAKRKLLWASRLDPEKRPDLLMKIATELEDRLPDVSIEVYGSHVLESFAVGQFAVHDNLTYKGPFSHFESIPHDHYDALIYTTAFDGMPNIVLEALSVGLPVIAPDVGGLREAVIPGETGWLLENELSEPLLIERYVAAIQDLYSPATDLERLRKGAMAFIRDRHSPERFLENVRAVFGIAADKAYSLEEV